MTQSYALWEVNEVTVTRLGKKGLREVGIHMLWAMPRAEAETSLIPKGQISHSRVSAGAHNCVDPNRRHRSRANSEQILDTYSGS